MKHKKNIFLRILCVFFIIFMFLYVLVNSGYYNSKMNKDIVLTDKKIKEFEQDIKEGKTIDLDNYYVEETKDYSSFVSNAGQNITLKLSQGLNSFFKTSSKVLKKLFWEE